jgi:HD-GYP domain-containing protein (c-di-GMP phosphodiesterase class II)
MEFSGEDQALAMNFASLASLALERSNLTRTLVLRIMGIAELHDPKETGAHIRRVSQVATRLFVAWASQRGWSEDRILKELDALRPAAMLHDVGKVGISDVILKKPGALTPEERTVMQSHTVIGAKSALKGQRTALDAAIRDVTLYHHARWDGTGYPTRAEIAAVLEELGEDGSRVPEPRGEGIPLAGRLVAIADVFDALMSRRAYKEAWSPADVRDEFERMSGLHFDPELVQLFLSDFDSYCAIHAAIAG